ncbi:coiled-coil domain-containing protein 87 [Tachyglossus aculeatus]|uniref:coiled-coil domain-containing protein 87 n=1 Tax=Tachyglossus aculeatus TaxID=9261 RepID=UPI0018F7167B|nr:coiled-coil domain-containing protein 87 [Tachyglossus aculeatus]
MEKEAEGPALRRLYHRLLEPLSLSPALGLAPGRPAPAPEGRQARGPPPGSPPSSAGRARGQRRSALSPGVLHGTGPPKPPRNRTAFPSTGPGRLRGCRTGPTAPSRAPPTDTGSSRPPPPPPPPAQAQASAVGQPRRVRSLPGLRQGWMLADELCLPPPAPRPLTPLVLSRDSQPTPTGATSPSPGTGAEDLRRLLRRAQLPTRVPAGQPQQPPSTVTAISATSSLDPLLGALTRPLAAGPRLEKLQEALEALQAEERSGRWDRRPPGPAPVHPQPATVTLELRGRTVRAAARRLPARAFSEPLHVPCTRVLYNHLTGELGPELVADLDASLWSGEAMCDVYRELLGCLSADHLGFDQGPLVEPASEVDWACYLASAAPSLRPSSRTVLNPQLKGIGRRGSASTDADDYFEFLATQGGDFLRVIYRLYLEEPPEEAPPAPKVDPLALPPVPPPLGPGDGEEGEGGERERPAAFVPGLWDPGTLPVEGPGAETPLPLLQKRLERVWAVLQVPEPERLDMAIKYSSDARLGQLPYLVDAWERALRPIQERETALARLERFETRASDPNRFFLPGEGRPGRRPQEAQVRAFLHAQLAEAEGSLGRLLEEIQVTFGEPVTLKGRPYLDKMKRDKVEMLFWLQQERRAGDLVHGPLRARLRPLVGAPSPKVPRAPRAASPSSSPAS